MFNPIADAHNAYYLVKQDGSQILVTVTEDFIESKVMAKDIVDEKFEIGEYHFRKVAYKLEK